MTLGNDIAHATRIAQNWFELPYPTFKRMAFFAASHQDCISPEQWVNWLLDDGCWWLWSTDTGREVLRLFVLQGRNLKGDSQVRLEAAILAGPLRDMYQSDIELERWKYLVDRSIWLHLAKLNASGLTLGAPAAERFENLSNAYPKWQLAANERDEFSHWMSGTGDPDYESSRDVEIAPRKRKELVSWLTIMQPDRSPFSEDTWRDVCRNRFFHSFYALWDLAVVGVWPAERWREALQVWSEEGMLLRSWRYAAPIVQTMPDNVIQEIVNALTWWIDTVSKSIIQPDQILLNLCQRVLDLPLDEGTGMMRKGVLNDQPVTEAINHPVGRVTQALINICFNRNPNDNAFLSDDIEPLFTKICDVSVVRFRHGRVILGSRLISIFRVDRSWTEQFLLPLLNWDNPWEAKAVWEGFLWSPRLYQPLLIAFKSQFLESAKHYAELGDHRQQFAAFLTYAALGPTEGYTMDEFRSALSVLPQEGLEESAQALFQALEVVAGQREDYWKNRVEPFWHHAWPKSRDLATPRIAESLTRLVIAARSEFPTALEEIQDWLQPIDHPYYILHLLQESGLCKQFQTHALKLLDSIIDDQKWWPPKELGQCLDQIVENSTELKRDARYIRLQSYLRMRGDGA